MQFSRRRSIEVATLYRKNDIGLSGKATNLRETRYQGETLMVCAGVSIALRIIIIPIKGVLNTREYQYHILEHILYP